MLKGLPELRDLTYFQQSVLKASSVHDSIENFLSMHDRDFEHVLNISRWHMQWPSMGEKMDLHKFYSRQIYRKIVAKLRSKCEANAKFASLLTTPCFGMQISNLSSLSHIYSSLFTYVFVIVIIIIFLFLFL